MTDDLLKRDRQARQRSAWQRAKIWLRMLGGAVFFLWGLFYVTVALGPPAAGFPLLLLGLVYVAAGMKVALDAARAWRSLPAAAKREDFASR